MDEHQKLVGLLIEIGLQKTRILLVKPVFFYSLVFYAAFFFL
jgi:hypothetical protein